MNIQAAKDKGLTVGTKVRKSGDKKGQEVTHYTVSSIEQVYALFDNDTKRTLAALSAFVTARILAAEANPDAVFVSNAKRLMKSGKVPGYNVDTKEYDGAILKKLTAHLKAQAESLANFA